MLFSNLTALSSQVRNRLGLFWVCCACRGARNFHPTDAVRLRAALFLLFRAPPTSSLRVSRLALQAQQSFDVPSSFDSCLCSEFDVGRWTACPVFFYGVERWTFAASLSLVRLDLRPVITASPASDRNAPDLAPRPRLRLTRSDIAIHKFGRHRHHD